MNQTLQDAIDEGLAALTPVQTAPTPPLGYGQTISCAGDLDPYHTTITGTRVIAEAIARRWDCPRGALPPDGRDAQDYGVDLVGYIHAGVTTRELLGLKARLEQEALKDDRIFAIEVKLAIQRQAGALVALQIDARVTPYGSAAKPFALVLVASSSGIIMQAIGGAT